MKSSIDNKKRWKNSNDISFLPLSCNKRNHEDISIQK